MILSCDHIGCPNGCTTLAGMCEACVRKALAEQRKELKKKFDALRCQHHPIGPTAAIGWNQALDAAKQAIFAQKEKGES